VLLEQISGGNQPAFQKAASSESPSRRGEDEMPEETGASPAINTDSPFGNEVSGLRSYQLFRESWARRHSDKLVSDAVRDLPENPGPLNSQLLVTRSLIIMRSLSPNYLMRFISYVDTLLWLEDASQTIFHEDIKN
jgi:hypothetical protein